MDWDFNIEGLTKTIAEFYAQQRAKRGEVPSRRTVTLQFPDGLMAYACDIAKRIYDALSVCFFHDLFITLPYLFLLVSLLVVMLVLMLVVVYVCMNACEIETP